MELVNVRDLFRRQDEYVDQTIAIGGWVRNIRNSKNFGFIVVNDGTFFEPVQVVYSDVLENFEEVEKLNVGAAIIVTGKLVATPGTKQPFEIQAEKVEVEGPSTPDYPLQKKKHSFEYLRTISHLRPRTNTFEAVFRVRSLCAYAIHKFFQERDFVYVHTPLITGSDCEGAGEMFQVTTLDMNNLPMTEDGKVDYSKDFFNKPTNLTVSGQLNGETYAMAFKNIYTFGPTFRAENSNTTRHAAEFWMIEPEIAFADLEDDMILAESMLKYVINYVLENAPEEMAFFNSFIDKGLLERLQHVANSDFARVTYTEAVEILEKNNDKFDYKVSWGCDLQTEHERYLTEQGFQVRSVANAEQMDRLLTRESFHLMVLDLMLPGEDGLSICRRLRSQSNPMPIIMVTAKGEEVDRIVGLEIGADDYIPKPFNPRELLARIRAVLRRQANELPGAPSQEEAVIAFGKFKLNLGTREMFREDEPMPLTSGEFAVLKALVSHPREPLSRDKLMNLARGREYSAMERSIDVQISRLRRMVEEDPAHPRYIQTVWGLGYVFVPDGSKA